MPCAQKRRGDICQVRLFTNAQRIAKKLKSSGNLYLCHSVLRFMFKLIIILVLVIYLLNKVSGFLFRILGQSRQQSNFRRPADGSVHMDAAPRKANKKSGLKGGEYVDYEEVK